MNSDLKDLIKLIGDSEVVASDLSDGFDFSDLKGLLTFAKDLPSVLYNSALIIPEWMDLDAAAQADLVAYVKTECKFPGNVAVEDWIRKVLSALIFLSSIVAILVKK